MSTPVRENPLSPVFAEERIQIERQSCQWLHHKVQRKTELQKEAAPFLEKIYKDIEVGLAWSNLIPRIVKISLVEASKHKLLTLGKLFAAAVLCYALKNVFIGIVSGEALVYSVPFEQDFSANSTVRINASALLTNATANASFLLDGLTFGYGLYILLFRHAYTCAAREVIQETLNKHLDEETIEASLSNEIYKTVQKDLARYR
jgi:hypothetical protein